MKLSTAFCFLCRSWTDQRTGTLLYSQPPSKGDFYSDDELSKILNLHESLKNEGVLEEKSSSSTTNEILSLHDMVLQTLESTPTYDVTPELRKRLLNVKAIVSDVDGTLLPMHPRTEKALKKAVEAAFSPVRSLQYFILATGKSKTGAMTSLGPELAALLSQLPGVYNQGLVAMDGNGNIVWEERLSDAQVETMLEFSEKRDLSLFLYDGDRILANEIANEVYMDEFHGKYGEPRPVKQDVTGKFHKCLIMDHDVEKIQALRPELEDLAESMGCVVTQAINTMLEVLPGGTNKGRGVRELCKHLGIDPEAEVLAIGDGENDLEFLEMASVGIAVGNAVAPLKEVADFVVTPVHEGGAGEAIELFGMGKILED